MRKAFAIHEQHKQGKVRIGDDSVFERGKIRECPTFLDTARKRTK